MGLIGRLLVLIYGAAALMCLMVAAMVYTQKMDFVTPKGEGGKKQVSRVEQAIDRTKELQAAVNRSYTHWRQEYDAVVPLEVEHYHRREFYRGQLELVRTGKLGGQAVPDPVQELDPADPLTGLRPINRPTGRQSIYVRPPRKEDPDKKLPADPGEKARPMAEYQQRIVKAGEDMKTALAGITDKIRQHSRATLVMNGGVDPEAKGVTVKGLRTRIREQEVIEADAINETAFLEDFVTNRRAQAQLFVKRRDALQARLTELIKFYQKTPTSGQGN